MDYDDPAVKSLAERLGNESPDELSLIRNTYHFVRDEIRHEELSQEYAGKIPDIREDEPYIDRQWALEVMGLN